MGSLKQWRPVVTLLLYSTGQQKTGLLWSVLPKDCILEIDTNAKILPWGGIRPASASAVLCWCEKYAYTLTPYSPVLRTP